MFLGQQEVHLGCGGAPAVIRGDDEGVIESPQVPGTVSYPDSANCSWIIVVNETKVRGLQFMPQQLWYQRKLLLCFRSVFLYYATFDSTLCKVKTRFALFYCGSPTLFISVNYVSHNVRVLIRMTVDAGIFNN